MGANRTIRNSLKRHFITGVAFTTPIAVTLWVMLYVYRRLADLLRDPFVSFYKSAGLYEILPRHVMAILSEVAFFVVFVGIMTVIGWCVARYFKSRGDNSIHRLFEHIPVVKSIFTPVKQAVQSFLGDGMDGRLVVRFPYPMEPCTAVGIVMDETIVGDTACFLVMMPLTMSAGTGVLLTVPKERAKVIGAEASQALAHVISCGMVKLADKHQTDGIRVKNRHQFWKAFETRSPRIELPLALVDNLKVPEELGAEARVRWCCYQLYRTLDKRTARSGLGRIWGKFKQSVQVCVYSHWYYAEALKHYSCSLDGDILVFRLCGK